MEQKITTKSTRLYFSVFLVLYSWGLISEGLINAVARRGAGDGARRLGLRPPGFAVPAEAPSQTQLAAPAPRPPS